MLIELCNMKKFFITILCVLYATQYLSSQNIEQKVYDLIASADYLELNRQYPLYKDSLSPLLQAIINPLLSSALNKPEKAATEIDFLLNNYTSELGNGVLNYIAMLGEHLYYIGEYKSATKLLSGVILSLKEQQVPNDVLSPLENLYKKVSALQEINKTTITRHPKESNQIDMLLNLKSSNDGWYVNGVINGENEPFLIDTGAGINLISESFAKKHHVRIMQDSILVSGLANSSFMKMGVVDSIIIGNIVYNNVVTGVVKDILPQHVQDSIGYKIDAILGVEFIKAIGGIIVYPKKKVIEIPNSFNDNYQDSPNTMLVGNALFIECALNGIRLIFNCDTGMGMDGYITFNSYNNHKEYLKDIKIINESNIRLGGFAGTDQYRTRQFESVHIGVKNRSIQVDNFKVLNIYNQYDGGLGIDYFKYFDKVVIDLVNMHIIVN